MSTRGDQLLALRKLHFDDIQILEKNTSVTVSAVALKSTLRAIDDHDGLDHCYARAETLAKETCQSERTVRRAIRGLVNLGLVSEKTRSGSTPILSINWSHISLPTPEAISDVRYRPTPEALTLTPEARASTPEARASTPETTSDKTEETRRTEKKQNLLSKLRFDDEDLQFSKWMFDGVNAVMPKSKEPDFEKWANEIRIIRESDHHSIQELRDVFAWANKDDFWSANIRSPSTLRKQFAVLHKKMKSGSFGNKHAAKVSDGVNFDPTKDYSNARF